MRRHHDAMAAVCGRICLDPLDAQDATQEACIAFVRGLARFDGRSALSSWAYRIATNAALDELRRRRRRPEPVADPGSDHAGTGSDHGRTAGIGRDPGVLDTDVTERLTVTAALATLPPTFRAAVVLRDVADLDYAEIGAILDIPAGTVRSRIARGRAQLARVLAADDDREPPDAAPTSNPQPRAAHGAPRAPAVTEPDPR